MTRQAMQTAGHPMQSTRQGTRAFAVVPIANFGNSASKLASAGFGYKLLNKAASADANEAGAIK